MHLDDIIDDIMTDTMGEVRSVLFTAMQSGMTIDEVCQCAKNAASPMEFVDAVMMYAGAMPDDMGRWV